MGSKTNKSTKFEKKFKKLKLEKIYEIKENFLIDPMIVLKKEFSIVCGLGNGLAKIYKREFPYNLQIELKIHSSNVNSILESKTGELITSSEDKSIKVTIYDIKEQKYEIIKTLLGHNDGVLKAIILDKKFDSELYASTSRDNTIKIWKKETSQSMLVYKNKELSWNLMELSNYRIIFSSSFLFPGLFIINPNYNSL